MTMKVYNGVNSMTMTVCNGVNSMTKVIAFSQHCFTNQWCTLFGLAASEATALRRSVGVNSCPRHTIFGKSGACNLGSPPQVGVTGPVPVVKRLR